MAPKASRQKFTDFMDYLSQKGLMNPATAQSRKASASAVFSVLTETEAEDLSTIDFDDVMNRFQHLKGQKLSPGSLRTYKSRAKSSLDDFIRYLEDPSNFRAKSPAGTRAPRSKKGSQQSRILPDEIEFRPVSSSIENVGSTASVADSIFPIPLRSNLIVYVQGLPFDLSKAEARKIANVITAMAIDTE